MLPSVCMRGQDAGLTSLHEDWRATGVQVPPKLSEAIVRNAEKPSVRQARRLASQP
jgi:hypothetical protein